MSEYESQSHGALRKIAAEASTLWERLGSDCYVCLNGPESAKLAATRLERWLERAARGNRQVFEKRLSWLGTTLQKVVHALGHVRLNGELPSWTKIFARAMDAAPMTADDASARRHPFGTILSSFARTGFEMLAPACHSVFTQKTKDMLLDDLLHQLSYIASPTLYLEFSVFHSAHRPSETVSHTQTERYEAFTARMLNGGLWDFFSEYPVLARLISVNVESWIRNVSELAESLKADLPEIQRVFNDDCSLGRVVAVRPSLSDKHDGGRTVTLLEFENGLKLIHKPRDIGIEKAWFALLQYLNDRGGEFRLLKVIDRKEHGWVEAVERAPCQNAVEAKTFYRRAGMLLGVMYALEASDCFHENIVACGSYPVLVDMETLMHHVLRRTSDVAPAEEIAEDILFDSVLRAGFLPSWEANADGVCVDISGLGGKAGQVTPYLMRRWTNINTDAMQFGHEPIRLESEQHLPQLDGASLDAAEYSEEIVAGFRHIYELLIELRGEMTVPQGVLDNLGRHEIRLVFHATRIYGLLLKRFFPPRYMRSGVERSIETDVASRFYLESVEKSQFLAILQAEIEALERLDIPRFAVLADSRSLSLPTGKTIENAFAETALDRVWRRLLLLNQSDLEMQTALIKASLRVSAISVRHEESARAENAKTREPQGTSSLSPDEIVAAAAAIAVEIESRAIFAADGSATWIAPQLLPQASYYALRPLRMDMYNGLAGVALFFSAFERVVGSGRRTALAALSPLRRFVSVADTSRMQREGYTLGAATGAGSFVYCLIRCAGLLQEPALINSAVCAAERITPEWIAADKVFDVMSGAAGAILGLLALHKETGNGTALDKARLCGDHLLKHRENAVGGAAWREANGRFLTGFSHGAAGIALALLRLAEASGEERFREAAKEATAFESSVFNPSEGNWPDFRRSTEGRNAFMNGWCHGATGIGMARIAGMGMLDSKFIREDIKTAIQAVSRGGLGEKDGLCCGNLGRAELLLAAALKAKEQPEQSASQWAALVIERARQSGGYRLSGRPELDFFDPSFFQGLSGVGYQLLRVAHPQSLPSVLVWE